MRKGCSSRISVVACAFALGVLGAAGCGGKKKEKPAAGPAKKEEGPPKWKTENLAALRVAVERPESFGVEPLGDGKTQVDLVGKLVKVNLYRRPTQLTAASFATAPAGSADAKVDKFAPLTGGAVWETAQLPPGGGEPFGWTIEAHVIDGTDELECYALIGSAEARKAEGDFARKICESLAVGSAAAAADGGAPDAQVK